MKTKIKDERLEAGLESIRHLLSHLHSEVVELESSYSQVLGVLRKLEKTCNIDDLTGLLRRNSFFQKWQMMLDECERFNQECGVLMIDIDHFKKINDTHGHAVGDEVIRSIAEMIKSFESPQCIGGRFGGEEFAVAIQGSRSEIEQQAELMRKQAAQMTGKTPNGDEWKCTISVGVASAQVAGYDASRQLRGADEALYDAKRSGRNRVSGLCDGSRKPLRKSA